MSQLVDSFMAHIIARDPAEAEFHQAVREVVESVMPAAGRRRVDAAVKFDSLINKEMHR